MNFMGRCCEGFAELTGSVYGNIKGSWGFYETCHESFIVDGMQRQKPAMRYLSYYFSRLMKQK